VCGGGDISENGHSVYMKSECTYSLEFIPKKNWVMFHLLATTVKIVWNTGNSRKGEYKQETITYSNDTRVCIITLIRAVEEYSCQKGTS
jgi:hypothetical protein